MRTSVRLLRAQCASARVVGYPLSRRRSMHSSTAAHAPVLLPLSARTVLAAAAAIRAPRQSRAPAPAASPGAVLPGEHAAPRHAWSGAASARAQTTVDGQHSAVGTLGVPCRATALPSSRVESEPRSQQPAAGEETEPTLVLHFVRLQRVALRERVRRDPQAQRSAREPALVAIGPVFIAFGVHLLVTMKLFMRERDETKAVSWSDNFDEVVRNLD